ncbi:MAG TPA: hypothetical protein VEK55_11185 [Xanthobacteraceae bacterium]|nr:hypothetical protein [Xanthobacteraceae bacterium]
MGLQNLMPQNLMLQNLMLQNSWKQNLAHFAPDRPWRSAQDLRPDLAKGRPLAQPAAANARDRHLQAAAQAQVPSEVRHWHRKGPRARRRRSFRHLQARAHVGQVAAQGEG